MSPDARQAVTNLTRLRQELAEDRAAMEVFRHAYGVALDAGKLERHAAQIRRLRPPIDASLDAFVAHLDGAIEALATDG